MRSPIGEGRERLLHALFDEFGENGPGANLSMRQVAERLDVHHTLLTYHFGSRAGLMAAVLSEARRRDNLVIAATDPGIGFVPLCRKIWNLYSDPAHEDRIRAFHHLAGLAVYEPDAFQEFVADVGELAHLLEEAALGDGFTPTDARQQSLIAVSCLRGLLLQRLLTPDTEIDAAAERFIRSLAAHQQSSTPSSSGLTD